MKIVTLDYILSQVNDVKTLLSELAMRTDNRFTQQQADHESRVKQATEVLAPLADLKPDLINNAIADIQRRLVDLETHVEAVDEALRLDFDRRITLLERDHCLAHYHNPISGKLIPPDEVARHKAGMQVGDAPATTHPHHRANDPISS